VLDRIEPSVVALIDHVEADPETDYVEPVVSTEGPEVVAEAERAGEEEGG
jgi:hypothetical protein